MRCLFGRVISAFFLFLPADLHAQTSNPSRAPQKSVETFLEEMARDEWVMTDEDFGWLERRVTLEEELKRRPQGALAALIRRAATRVDLELGSVVVRRADQLSISIDTQPRFVLDTPIPYVAQIHASVDGGAWFRLGRVRGGFGCGTSGNRFISKLAAGIHRMQIAVDISYLRESVGGTDGRQCVIDGDSDRSADELLNPVPEDMIQSERRVLPAVSFGIFPDLLGASTVLAHTLEAGLPEIPLDRWLDGIFSEVTEGGRISRGSWTVEYCRPEESWALMGPGLGGFGRRQLAARRRPRDLCVNLLADLPDDRMLSLRLRVGTLHEDAAAWSFEPPTFHDLSLGGTGNVMDVPYLGLLPRVLTVPAAAFPRLDVSVDARDLRYEPADARPGDPITITATLRNIAAGNAAHTSGFVALEAITPTRSAIARGFLVDIPADSSVNVSLRTTMPASGTIVVQVPPFPATRLFGRGPYSLVRDVDSENNTAIKHIGRPQPER